MIGGSGSDTFFMNIDRGGTLLVMDFRAGRYKLVFELDSVDASGFFDSGAVVGDSVVFRNPNVGGFAVTFAGTVDVAGIRDAFFDVAPDFGDIF